MTVHFVTFGCKVNCYESACLRDDFEHAGYTVTDDAEKSDVIIINSCTVTAASDKKVRQTLRKLRKENQFALIVLTGCLPQAFPEEAAKLTQADIITGTKNRPEILKMVLDASENRSHTVNIVPYRNGDKHDSMTCTSFEDKTRAFVKIQDGCNQFCSYCIIPYSRGRVRSKKLEDLISEVTLLAENGHQEIVLVGINLAFYGAEYGLSLTDAVEACCAVKGVKRVRLGSLEPEKILDDDLDRLAALDKFCPQFHLSLQSGCDKTLRAMNRKYSAAEYTELVGKIRSRFPDASVTTDVMVGFPGETEEDFLESMDFVKKTGFSRIHVFPYSVRPGTKAASMSGQIPGDIKNRRAAEMTAAGAELEKKFLEEQIGRTVPVLFEKENCTSFHQGYSPNYTLVKIKRINSINSLRNKIFYVNIEEAMNDFCIGSVQDGIQITE